MGEVYKPCCQTSSWNSNTTVNHSLLELALHLNKRTIAVCEGKVMCEECDVFHSEDELLKCTYCDKSNVCYPCLFENHDGHGWSKKDVHADHRNHHKSTDHSLFADRRVLNVNGQEFVVSATLLSMHSPFFENLFFGSPNAMSLSQFSLDADPTQFSDLMDMIYPYYHRKRVYDSGCDSNSRRWESNTHRECCEECTQKLEDRFQLMIRFEFTNLLHRMSHFVPLKDRMAMYGTLKDDWTAFGKYVLPYFEDFSELEQALRYKNVDPGEFKRFFDDSHKYIEGVPRLLPRLHYPDSRVLLFDGLPLVVCASVLCLSAGGLIDFFYGEQNRDKRVIEFNLCKRETFDLFVSTVHGTYPKREDLDGSFIKFCRAIDARFAIQYYYR